MKKLIALLALLCLPLVAHARILVVNMNQTDDVSGLIPADWEFQHKQMDRLTRGVVDALKLVGTDYALVPEYACSTATLRTGVMVWNRGTAGRTTEQFDGVILINPHRRKPKETPYPRYYEGCYACSLTTGGSTNYPIVPNLWLFGSMNGYANQVNLGADLMVTAAPGPSAASCSTGVKTVGGSGLTYASIGDGASPSLIRYRGSTGAWLSAANIGAWDPGAVASTTGGVRNLLLLTGQYHLQNYLYNGRIETANADSIMGSDGDTTVVWERPFTDINSTNDDGETVPCKPIVFANIMGASPCTDSLNADYITAGAGVGFDRQCEFDGSVLMFALARFDSLTGGQVFKKPIKAAVVIKGGFERIGRRFAGGSNDDDSTVVKASIDSLKALGVPLTVTVNVDSIASYPNEIAWWNTLGQARFAPVATTGLSKYVAADTANVPNAAWSESRPVDIFGRFRTRSFYVPNDSSVYGGLKAAQDIAKTYGFNNLSKTVIAPLDDWSPRNMRWATQAYDSLLYAFRKAGYSAVLADVQRPEGSIFRIPAANRDRVQGWFGKQEWYRNKIDGERFAVVGHTGYNITGGSMNFMQKPDGDSASVPGFSYGSTLISTPTASNLALSRFWGGLLHDRWDDYDWSGQNDATSGMGGYLDIRYSSADTFHGYRRASVLLVHVSDLGGVPNGPPARPGWWAIKSIKRSFQAINAVAGRTVAVLGYPEDLEP